VSRDQKIDILAEGFGGDMGDRVFCQMYGDLPGNPDGMKVDREGNLHIRHKFLRTAIDTVRKPCIRLATVI
jgi:sugar lactone lactonase YvrE